MYVLHSIAAAEPEGTCYLANHHIALQAVHTQSEFDAIVSNKTFRNATLVTKDFQNFAKFRAFKSCCEYSIFHASLIPSMLVRVFHLRPI
jgi:hypothetical protein